MDPVIIVGAGPVGLALSLALARHDVPTVVLDAGEGHAPSRAARTCVLRADTAALLPPLDGAHWTGWRTQRRRHTVQHIRLDDDSAPLHVEQHTLERSLRTTLTNEPLAEIVTGSHVDLLEQDPDGVTAHTRGHRTDPNAGPSAERKGGTWWRGSHLVGCDGARSTVRKLLGVRFTGRTSVERHAVAALRTQLPWGGEALLHRDPGGETGEVTARPLPGGVWRLDWLLPPRGGLVTPEQLLESVRGTLTHWQQEHTGSRDAQPPAYELLDTGVYTCHQRLAQRWRVGRAFLAGDAAHLLGALGVQSVDEGLRDVTNLAWKLSVAWHEQAGSSRDDSARRSGGGREGSSGGGSSGGRDSGSGGSSGGQDADVPERPGGDHGHGSLDALLDSYETERRAAVGARLRAVDQALPLVRRDSGGLRSLLPNGGTRGHLELLTDAHLGRGLLGAPATYKRSPLLPGRGAVGTVPVSTTPGAAVHDVPVTTLNGERARLRERLHGTGGELLVVLVAPGTGVWDSRHWLSAGMMPELTAAVQSLPVRAELLVTESYPEAAAHTLLVIRADGHLVAALPGIQPDALRTCADAVRGTPLIRTPVQRAPRPARPAR